MSLAKTLRSGDTAAKRKLVETTTATNAPAATDAGWGTDGADWIHIYAGFTGTVTQANVTPWYYSEIAEQWFANDPVVFTATTKFALTELRGGGEKLYLQVTAITGTGTVSLWAGRSYDGRSF